MDSFMPPNQILLLLVGLVMCTTSCLSLPPEAPPTLIHKLNATTPTPPQHPHKLNATDEFLLAHNRARAEVGVGPLHWSQKLAMDTSRLVRYQRNKKGCKFSDTVPTEYGMNQMWAGGLAVTPSAAVELWVEEKKYYNHDSNSCAKDHKCGVYTQVVWKKSVEVGCAQATCVKEHATLTICFYSPPGNIVGEKPY